MRLRAISSTTGAKIPWPIWVSSVLFSLVVLAGYRVLEQRAFLPVVGVLALVHLLTVITQKMRLSWHLFLSQSCVVTATVGSVVLHVSYVVGEVPSGLLGTVASFLEASVTSSWTYLYFSVYVVAFCLVLGVVLLVIRTFWRSVEIELAIVAAYSMSSVNVAFDYSLSRPLYNVSGEADALDFFFSAGLFGLEFSLPLHVLLLVVSVGWYELANRSAPVRRENEYLPKTASRRGS